MKILNNLKKYLVLATLALFIASCEKTEIIEESPNNEQELNETPTDDAVFPTEVSEIAKEIAKIQKNGHEYRFIAVGENDDMVVIEKLYGMAEKNSESSNIDGELTPFEIFIALTDAAVKVPERIAITAKESIYKNSGRQIDKSNFPVEILDVNYSDSLTQKGCYDVGYTGFRNSYCGGTPVTSTPTDIRFCDNGLWTSNTRNSHYGGSWRERDDIQTWTNVVCGLTRVQFYAWKSSGIWPFNSYSWHLQYQVDFTNGIWYANYYTSDYTERQVKRTRPTNSGSFRAYTRFF
ncbi:hypothetical protein [uncultured Lacinutrix sp.]|uniref:hypothetical protein n=1 Tax=uncultured Lacinutrix sp. TaxID=574032 RepID=UPI00260D068D|nr:hypothetical protein [uncultured Lacinutrix sp.]